MPLPRMFNHFAGSSGNDDGINAVDAHAAQTDYYITPPEGSVYHVARLIFSIDDDKGMEIEEFGTRTALVGGISIVVSRYDEDTETSTEEVINEGMPIKNNGQFGHLCYDIERLAWANTTSEQAVARWTFSKSGAPIVLNYQDKLIVRFLADSDTSAITLVHMAFQGVDLKYAD